MKKSTIKLIAMLLAVVLMLPNFAGAGALNENEVDDGLLTWEEVEEIGRLEAPATKAYEEIINSWANEDGNITYPAAYGGCFLDTNYRLVVNLVNNNAELRDEIISVVETDNIIEFRSVDISHNQLFSIQNTLTDYLPHCKVISSCVSYVDNAVNVQVKSPGNVADALSIIAENSIMPDSQHINISYVNDSVFPETNENDFYLDMPISNAALVAAAVSVNPGELIYSTKGSETGTLGWYGKFKFNGSSSYTPCILLAGHVAEAIYRLGGGVKAGGTEVYPNSRFDDKNYYYSYLYGDMELGCYSGDYALLAYKAGSMTQSNKLDLGYDSSATIIQFQRFTSMLTGKSIFKSYGKSGCTVGIVQGPATSELIRNLISVECSGRFCTEGDSGAPCYYTNSSGARVLCAFVTGYNKYDSSISYCTPLQVPYDAGFVPYMG